MSEPADPIHSHLERTRQVLQEMKESCGETLRLMGTELEDILDNGGTIYLCGNGGSAAHAQHIAAELVGRYEASPTAQPAVAFTTDTSILTAVSNDFGYEEVFKRQVEAFIGPSDALIGISTSGTSENVIRAGREARDRGAIVYGWTGRDGGSLPEICDRTLHIPADRTAIIQEGHQAAGHILCEHIENQVFD